MPRVIDLVVVVHADIAQANDATPPISSCGQPVGA
jgi:hypothetical protein